MVEFLTKHKLINTSQHGFLKARSCLTSLLCFLEEITKWVDDGSLVDVVYLDFQKPFDKVPHQRVLLKLKAHGRDLINWIEKWLTHKRHRVIVDGEIRQSSREYDRSERSCYQPMSADWRKTSTTLTRELQINFKLQGSVRTLEIFS